MTHCPRCNTPLADPPERFCPNCGFEVAGAAAPPPIPPAHAPTPDAGWSPGAGPRGDTPWERRDEIGLVSALVETIQRVITSPAAFYRGMPTTGGVGGPLLFAILVGYVGLVISSLYDFVLESVMGSSFTRFGGGNEAVTRMMPYLQGGMALGIKLILGPVLIAIGVFLWSAIVHLALMILGAGSRGYEATFRVAAYAEAAALFNIVPICGGALGAVYMLVLMIIGTSEAHGVSRGRAAAAVLLPVFLCCCCLGGLFGVGMMSIMNQINK